MCIFRSTTDTHLIPTELPDGTLVAKHPNCAVSASLLKEILEWHRSGASHADILSRLRVRTVPQGYAFSPWNSGKLKQNCKIPSIELCLLHSYVGQTESETDMSLSLGVAQHMMRSILAQLEYSYELCRYDSVGVPFRQYMYVPETHTVTSCTYHEREDEPHVLKVSTSTFYPNFSL